MIDGLRPYLEIAETELGWLRQVPAHWQVMRAKHLFREVDSRSVDGAETHLSMHQKLGLVPSATTGEKRLVSESYAGGKVVQPDDLVLNRLKAHLGVFAHASQHGVISPDYTVLRPLPNAIVRYYEYLLKSPACRGELRIRIKGIVEGFWRLYTDDFYDIRLPVPPLDEQRLIVRFLNWHGAMTVKLIRAKQRLIALLNEQKQSIIHRTVTRGLDPAVKLRPSGVEWIGDVPEHWEVKPLKRTCRFEYGDALAADKRVDGPVKVYGSNGAVGNHDSSNTDAPAIVIGRKGSFGKLNWSDDPVFVIDTAYHVPLSSTCTNHRWLFHILSAAKLDAVSNDTAIPGLSREDAYGRLLAVPPTIEEQSAIAKSIDDATKEADAAIAAIQNEIALIQEFRASLIANVVTGQFDVRAIAGGLPDCNEADVPAELTAEADLEDDADSLIDEEDAA